MPEVAGRGRKIERVWVLSDPAYPQNYDREVLLLGEPPVRAWCDGVRWWNLGTGAVIHWWLPPGALVHVDFDNNHFYWEGAVRSISDLTDNGDGRYILIPSTPLDFSSGEQVVVYDYSLDMEYAGTRSGTLWQVREGTGNTGTLRARVTTAITGVGQNFTDAVGNYYDTANQTISLSMFSKNGEGVSFPGSGRHRVLLRMKNGQPVAYQPDNGEYREITSSPRVVTTIPNIERVMFNASWSVATQAPSALLEGGTLHSLTIYNRDLSAVEREAVGRTGIAPPVHILGDSFMTLYRPQHNISKMLEDQGVAGYFGMSSDAVGSTSLEQQFIRYREAAAKWRRSTLVIGEMGASVGMVEALQKILRLIEHERWLVLEPAPAKTQVFGTPAREAWDAQRLEFKAACGANWVSTLEPAWALANGSADDAADVANGIWPRSLTVSNTDFHPSALGDEFMAWVIYTALVERGWRNADPIPVFQG